MPFLITVAIAASGLVLFLLLATFFVLTDMELNPLSRSIMAVGNSK